MSHPPWLRECGEGRLCTGTNPPPEKGARSHGAHGPMPAQVRDDPLPEAKTFRDHPPTYHRHLPPAAREAPSSTWEERLLNQARSVGTARAACLYQYLARVRDARIPPIRWPYWASAVQPRHRNGVTPYQRAGAAWYTGGKEGPASCTSAAYSHPHSRGRPMIPRRACWARTCIRRRSPTPGWGSGKPPRRWLVPRARCPSRRAGKR